MKGRKGKVLRWKELPVRWVVVLAIASRISAVVERTGRHEHHDERCHFADAFLPRAVDDERVDIRTEPVLASGLH